MAMEPRILLVDDEVPIQRAVAPLLRARGYDVEVAATAEGALSVMKARPPDLILLDLALPDLDGTEVCRRVRRTSTVPIIVLSARTGERDKVEALELGADDYVTKPFGAEELVARIRVALRRTNDGDENAPRRVTVGDLTIDYERHTVVRNGHEIRLSPKEFELLALLANHADRVLSNRTIVRALWSAEKEDEHEHLWVLVAQLRKKIEPDPSRPRYLVNQPWVGYRLAIEPAD